METISFMSSLLTFYLKGEIAHEQNFIKLKTPNTILSLIPLGAKNDTIPVTQISSVETNFKLLFKNFIIGLVVAIIGLSLFRSSFLAGLIVLLIGAGMVINSFQTVLCIRLTSSTSKYISFLVFEKSKAELAANQINTIISNRLDDTNNRVHTEKQTEAIVDAISSLKK